MKTKVVDKTGKEIGDIDLSKKVFGVAPNDVLLTQYLRVYRANQRQGNASTKDRGEVSGSGKKPWRQKGTGNARAGTKRSPIWRHGGVAHGPKPKSWRLDFPKKMRKLALLIALSQKNLKDNVVVIDKLNFKKPSSKEAVSLLKDLNLRGKSLVVLDEADHNIIKSFKNVRNAKTSFWGNLNTFDVLSCEKVLFTKSAVMKVQGKYENK